MGGDGRGRRVLIASGIPEQAARLAELVGAAGWVAPTVYTAAEVRCRLRLEPSRHSALLVDWQLADGDASTLADELCSDATTPSFVLLSSHVTVPDAIVRAAACHLRRPLDGSAPVIAALEEAARSTTARRHRFQAPLFDTDQYTASSLPPASLRRVHPAPVGTLADYFVDGVVFARFARATIEAAWLPPANELDALVSISRGDTITELASARDVGESVVKRWRTGMSRRAGHPISGGIGMLEKAIDVIRERSATPSREATEA